MSYFMVDGDFHSHPKVIDTSSAAIGLWVMAGSWSKRHGTGGHVTPGAVRTLGSTAKFADELVRVGLWEKTDRGYVFHDWAAWGNVNHVEEVRRRRLNADRQARWRDAQKASLDARRTGN